MRSEVTIAVYESSNHVAYPNAVFRDLTDCTLLGYPKVHSCAGLRIAIH